MNDPGLIDKLQKQTRWLYEQHQKLETRIAKLESKLAETTPPENGKAKKFTPPTIAEVEEYAKAQGWRRFNAARFVDHYQMKGWYVGSRQMRDWKAAARNAQDSGWCLKSEQSLTNKEREAKRKEPMSYDSWCYRFKANIVDMNDHERRQEYKRWCQVIADPEKPVFAKELHQRHFDLE